MKKAQKLIAANIKSLPNGRLFILHYLQGERPLHHPTLFYHKLGAVTFQKDYKFQPNLHTTPNSTRILSKPLSITLAHGTPTQHKDHNWKYNNHANNERNANCCAHSFSPLIIV
jgi:hypothetical protein